MTTLSDNDGHRAGTSLGGARGQAQLVEVGGVPVAPENTARSAFSPEGDASRLVAAQAAVLPDAVAVAAGEDVLTYRELDARANQLGHALRAMGVGPEVVVGLCFERSVDLVVGALGIWRAGGAYLPLDPDYPTERLRFMLTDARVPVLVTYGGSASRLADGPWQVIALDSDRAALARHPATAPAVSVDADTLAYVIYTSGSTGTPKGVEITHGSLLNLVQWHRRTFEVTSADRATQIASPAFDASVWELWPYLTAGASVHVPDMATRVAPDALRDWFVAQRITISFLPTPLAEIAMTLAWPSHTALRVLLTGGDALHTYPPPALPFPVINNYGPTESTVVTTSGRVPPVDNPGFPPSLGHPITNIEVYILDAERRPVAAGVEGELYIGGAGLARGYRHRPELTAERFVPHPFSAIPGTRLYRTGDMARFRPDGSLDFLGRADDQVKIRGRRVELGEITATLNRHPAVRTSHVTTREDRPGAVQLVAYVVSASGHEPTAADLQAFLGTALPDFMVPATYVRIQSVPMTANGKVDTAALPAPDAENGMRDASGEGPRTPLEARLAEIVATLLGLPQVGVHDDFFQLGGHSLLGTQLISRVRDAFAVEVPLLALFESPTVAELAAEVERLIVADVEAMSDEEVRQFPA